MSEQKSSIFVEKKNEDNSIVQRIDNLTAQSIKLKNDNPPTSINDMLAMAVQAGQIEMIKTLADLRTKEIEDQRRIAFNIAMANAQSEMQRIAPDSVNPQTHSKYAKYEKLNDAIRPIVTKYGFGLTFSTVEGQTPDIMHIVCLVTHIEGYSKEYHISLPADGKGAKGGEMQTKTHAAGSAVTYGMRYLLKMIFNLSIGERDDDDGNAAGGKATLYQAQAEELRRLAEEAGVPEIKICAAYGVSSIDAIPAAMFEPAKRQLLRKIKSSGAGND